MSSFDHADATVDRGYGTSFQLPSEVANRSPQQPNHREKYPRRQVQVCKPFQT